MRILLAVVLLLSLGCGTAGKWKRHPAAELSQPALKYFFYRDDGAQEHVFTQARWEGEGGFTEKDRYYYLLKMFYASTRTVSPTAPKRAACFEGQAQEVADAFFSPTENHKILNVLDAHGVPEVKASVDGKMLGLRFKFISPFKRQEQEAFFRLPNCQAGKSPVASSNRSPARDTPGINTGGDNLGDVLLPPPSKGPHKTYGFLDVDKLAQGEDPENKLPRFKLKADYNNAKPSDTDRPWKGMDITTEAGALQFALVLQKYFYEGMANQNKQADFNFIAQNSTRYWCHMPWMNLGPSGREAIHGMTKERDLKPSPTMKDFKNATPGTDWGVAYYNSYGCVTLGEIFGDASDPKEKPDYSAKFPMGTFNAKILFTTADFPQIKKAFTWTGNGTLVGETARHLLPMRHIQMDIAVKDDTIIGSKKELGHWVMLTYYYDAGYKLNKTNPLRQIQNLPAGLKKMRPMGIQIGFETPARGDTVIFKNAETNGLEGRLNGPADNFKSSCLSCHGTAGTPLAMVPGILLNQDFVAQKEHMDFSQQVALAKRNLETYIQNENGDR